MKRREFITLLGGAAAAWPVVARAQQDARVRRVGVLMAYAVTDAEAQSRIAAFRKRLQELGWIEGRNVQIDYRWAAGDAESIRAYAHELVDLKPDCHCGQKLAGGGGPSNGDAHDTSCVCTRH